MEACFRQLLADVEKGETIVVTQDEEPVAHIVPAPKTYAIPGEAIDDWRRYRRERNLRLGEGITIREFIEEGRE